MSDAELARDEEELRIVRAIDDHFRQIDARLAQSELRLTMLETPPAEVPSATAEPAIGLCATCRHWTPPQGPVDDWPDEAPTGYGTCALGEREYGYPRSRDTLAVAVAVLGDCASLRTKPDFGCVMHETKEEAP